MDQVGARPAGSGSVDGGQAEAQHDPAPLHLLIYNDPDDPDEGHGVGWTLVTRHGPGCRVSMALAARGAGAHATARVAKAVAVRVLAARGVAVESWHTAGPDEPAAFRARLRHHDGADPVVPAPRRPRWRGPR